jgi:hypothetical protein
MSMLQSEDYILPHSCRNAALCMTAKLIVEWQRWVMSVGLMPRQRSRHVRFPSNSV